MASPSRQFRILVAETKGEMIQEMDKVDVHVTWGLVWALWWRMMLISLGVYAVVVLPFILIAGLAAIPW